MIISDLNYVEVVETSEIQGGLRQTVNTRQRAIANAGNNGGGGISIGNVALALNLNLPTVIGAELFTVD